MRIMEGFAGACVLLAVRVEVGAKPSSAMGMSTSTDRPVNLREEAVMVTTRYERKNAGNNLRVPRQGERSETLRRPAAGGQARQAEAQDCSLLPPPCEQAASLSRSYMSLPETTELFLSSGGSILPRRRRQHSSR